MRKTGVVVGMLVAVLAFAGGAEAKRPRCKKQERFVEAGTAVFSGPGLGFEAIAITKDGACLRALRTTDDGSFALVQLEKDRVGWVATGLVDAALSEDAKAEPLPTDEKAKKALLEAALREAPRVDAKATGLVKKGESLAVKGRSPDGLWLFVEAGRDKGWLPRYQTGESLPEAGAAPQAGTGAWRVRSPSAVEPSVAAEAASKGGAKKPAAGARPARGDGKAADGGAKAADGGARAEGGAPPADPDAAGRDAAGPDAPGVESPLPEEGGLLLGRSQELSLFASFGGWSQRYLSDAQNDPFYRYALSSSGGGGGLGYAWRGELPLVFDLRASFGVFGFDIAAPGPDGAPRAFYQNVFTVDSSTSLGWRLYGSTDVDVEASVGAGVSVVWLEGLDDGAGNVTPAFTPGVYVHLFRPSLQARSRLFGGDLGLLVLEAALPVGTYLMPDDPGDRYLKARAEDKVQPPALPPAPGVVVDPNAPPAADEGAPLAHLGFGVEGRVRYQLPLGSLLRFDTSAGIEVRQALIGGPGLRVKGAYSEATNIDLTASVTAGLTFGF